MSETNKEELEETWPGDEPDFVEDESEMEDGPKFPDEEIGEELPEEEEKSLKDEVREDLDKEGLLAEEEEEQPSLFEGDKVYNALHTALTDINDSIKRIQKAIDSKKVELQVCETRKKEIQEAIEVYEKQRQEAE